MATPTKTYLPGSIEGAHAAVEDLREFFQGSMEDPTLKRGPMIRDLLEAMRAEDAAKIGRMKAKRAAGRTQR